MSIREGYKQTEIGVIPEEWEVVELEKVCIKISDGIHTTPKYVENSEYYFVNGNNLVDGKITINPQTKCISESEWQKHKKELNDQTVLLSINGTIGNVAFFQNEQIVLGKSAAYLVCSAKLNKFYLGYLLKAERTQKYFELELTGTTIRNLSLKSIKSTPIGFPPLPEQQKIAEILSTVDQKIDSIDSKIEETQTLKRGLMQRLLSQGIGHSEFKESEIGRIPTGWNVVGLPELAEKITSGGTPSRAKPEYFEYGTINWIKTGELKDCYIYDAEEKITPEAIANSSAKIFPADTLLVAMYGATIGQTAYLRTECSTNQACCAIIFDQQKADPHFYWKYFTFIKDNLISKGIGAGQPNISQGIIKELLFPFPPLEEQKQIAEILSTTDEKLESLRAKKETFETLKKGLMQKLLSGEVRV